MNKAESLHRVVKIFGIKFAVRKELKADRLHLVFDSKTGIANRVLALISYDYLLAPSDLSFSWPDTGWVPAKFSDIFDWKARKYTEFSEEIFRDDFVNLQTPRHILSVRREDFCKANPPLFGIFKKIRYRRYLKYLYNDIPEGFKKIYADKFSRLKPSAAVQQRIAGMGAMPANYLAVQVRNNNDWNDYGRNESLEKFFQKIDGFPKDTKIYISAMSEEIFKIFEDRYGGRLFGLSQKDYGSMIDAAADLYLLGAAQNAIFSYGSTFPELAWWLGGAKSRVQVVGSGGKWKTPPQKNP